MVKLLIFIIISAKNVNSGLRQLFLKIAPNQDLILHNLEIV